MSGPREPEPSVCRCVCRGVEFARITELPDGGRGMTDDQVCSALGMGDRCGMCIPYIRPTVLSGRACHHPIPRGGRRV